MSDYSKALVEVEETLKYLPEEDFVKIPKELIESIKNNKDNDYMWQYDTSKNLLKQNLREEAINILAYINFNYLLDEEQKKYMSKKYRENGEFKNSLKKEKYNIDNLFDNNDKENKNDEVTEEKSLFIIKKESFFTKIIKMIHKVLNIKNK